MAFDKYKNGAWQEPESTVSRYDKTNGYWVSCDTAKRNVSGAWNEVWANVKVMTQLSNNLTTGMLSIQDDGLKFYYMKFMGYYGSTWEGTIDGSGTFVFYLDGQWTNPTISFDWEGGFIRSSSDYSTWCSVPAGSISLYHRTTGGTVGTTTAESQVGTTETSTNGVFSEQGSYQGTLSGTYNRLGLSITISGYSGKYYSAMLEMIIKNLHINGTKIAFPISSEFDYTN